MDLSSLGSNSVLPLAGGLAPGRWRTFSPASLAYQENGGAKQHPEQRACDRSAAESELSADMWAALSTGGCLWDLRVGRPGPATTAPEVTFLRERLCGNEGQLLVIPSSRWLALGCRGSALIFLKNAQELCQPNETGNGFGNCDAPPCHLAPRVILYSFHNC